MNYISQHKPRVIEGELRIDELAKHLEKFNSPKTVWLSEDGSGIVSKVAYDSSTNQLVGVVLPTDSNTRFPISFSYTPHNYHDIVQCMEKPHSSLIYLIMAQPVSENVPPFILSLFGTDNGFTTQDVMFRWKHIKNESDK